MSFNLEMGFEDSTGINKECEVNSGTSSDLKMEAIENMTIRKKLRNINERVVHVVTFISMFWAYRSNNRQRNKRISASWPI
mmetsp:Transcript_28296/g.32547  ORF Transcript_28296/g.32547 Transcript_28296/m.32547 type:complete len:81 (+) Transcript_28296:1432-1674(+)